MEKAMAPHSSVLAGRIPGTGEPGGLQSLGSHRVGRNGIDLAAAAAARSFFLVNDPGVGNLASGSPVSLYLDFLSLLFSVM